MQSLYTAGISPTEFALPFCKETLLKKTVLFFKKIANINICNSTLRNNPWHLPLHISSSLVARYQPYLHFHRQMKKQHKLLMAYCMLSCPTTLTNLKKLNNEQNFIILSEIIVNYCCIFAKSE